MERYSAGIVETLKLVGAYHRIRRAALRMKLLALVRDLGDHEAVTRSGPRITP